jgi:hypothetical protein
VSRDADALPLLPICAVSDAITLTRSSGTPATSAATWAMIVWLPCPQSAPAK